MKRILAASLLMLSGLPALAAGVPRRLADVDRTGPEPSPLESPTAGGFVQAGGRLVFSIGYRRTEDDGSLWATDGTPAGTAAIAAICPATCQGVLPLATLRSVALLQTLTADFGGYRTRLWRTDGTARGTWPLTPELSQIGETSLVVEPPAGPPVFYFTACREADGCELWRTDGTRGGTALVRDLCPGCDGRPHSFVAWRGRLYFVAADGGEKRALFATDGTAAGTVRLLAVDEGDDDQISFQQDFAPTPSRLFFTNGYRNELWATDGTPAGTRRLRRFEANVCVNHYYCFAPFTDALTAFGDEVYFTASDGGKDAELWKSDGTEAGTRRLTRLPQGFSPRGASLRRIGGRWTFLVADPEGVLALWAGPSPGAATSLTGCRGGCPTVRQLLGRDASGRVLFQGGDAAHGSEPWVTDGTASGTHRLADICPGPCSGLDYDIEPGAFPGGTYFRAHPGGLADLELWVTDGTPAGTRRVAGDVQGIAAFHGRTWFAAVPPGPGTTVRLWTTDGTAAGTRRAMVLRVSGLGSTPLFAPAGDGGALFAAWDGGGQRIWRSDGTPEGTAAVAGLENGFGAVAIPPVRAGSLHFLATLPPGPDPGTFEPPAIWRTDGTAAGTFRVARLARGQYLWPIPWLAWQGKLLFKVESREGCALWSSDGTEPGTKEIVALPAKPGAGCVDPVEILGDRIFFVSTVPSGPDAGTWLFASDGTPVGTSRVSRLGEGSQGNQVELFRSGGTLVAQVYGGPSVQVWLSDGTPEGTRPTTDLGGEPALFGFGGSLYFTMLAAAGDLVLWRAPLDGRPAFPLGRVSGPITYGDRPPGLQLTAAGGRLFFVGGDAEHGYEPWTTDGTSAGTHRLRDLLPGRGSSLPSDFVAAGSRVFFTAHDGKHGRELWESDGTAAGTRLVADLHPGALSSVPTGLTLSGANLYFSADDGSTGLEPWVLPLTPQ